MEWQVARTSRGRCEGAALRALPYSCRAGGDNAWGEKVSLFRNSAGSRHHLDPTGHRPFPIHTHIETDLVDGFVQALWVPFVKSRRGSFTRCLLGGAGRSMQIEGADAVGRGVRGERR